MFEVVELMIKLIGVAVTGWMISSGAEPVQYLKIYVGLGEENMGKSFWKDWLIKLINCSMCITFYIALLVFFNLWFAMFCSFLSYLIDNYSRKNHNL